MTRWIACIPLLLTASQAVAHPHVFVDSALRIETDAARNVTGVELSWAYDEFFTLLIFEDMGLDPDGDGQLTEDELAQLQGFETNNWPADFEGDLYLASQGETVALGAPEPRETRVEDGRIISGHFRLVPGVAADGLEIRQYDPTFYVSYEITRGVEIAAPCRAEIEKPDRAAADAYVQKELQSVPEDQFEVLEIGEQYADRISLTCEPSS